MSHFSRFFLFLLTVVSCIILLHFRFINFPLNTWRTHISDRFHFSLYNPQTIDGFTLFPLFNINFHSLFFFFGWCEKNLSHSMFHQKKINKDLTLNFVLLLFYKRRVIAYFVIILLSFIFLFLFSNFPLDPNKFQTRNFYLELFSRWGKIKKNSQRAVKIKLEFLILAKWNC